MSSGFRLSARSRANLVGVHSDLVLVVQRALQLSVVDFSVTEGLRTAERQRQLVAEGKSQTQNSRHLTGHAVDVVAYVPGQDPWAWEHYERINEAFQRAASEIGVPIIWGGSWKTLKDGPHFELDRWAYP